MIKFCIEPLAVPNEEINVDWTSNEEQIIDSRNDVTISIKQYDWYGQLSYALEFENKRREQVGFELYDIIINGDIVAKNKEQSFVSTFTLKLSLISSPTSLNEVSISFTSL